MSSGDAPGVKQLKHSLIDIVLPLSIPAAALISRGHDGGLLAPGGQGHDESGTAIGRELGVQFAAVQLDYLPTDE